MHTIEAQLFMDCRCMLGEGPVWDEKTNRIYWIDIRSRHIHHIDLSTTSKHVVTVELEQMIGSLALRAQGGIVAALQHGFYIIDPDSGKHTLLSDPEQQLEGNRFNDGKCDPAGRFWAGTMAMNEVDAEGSLYSIDGVGKVMKHVSHIGVSNGLAWNVQADTMYYIDSPTREVKAYDYDLHTGNITRPRTVITFDPQEGYPDGMTIDEEGMLWIAHWEGWQVSRWNPHTGKKLSSIRVPVSRVTSCVFGGTQMNELFITSAHVGLNEAERSQQPHAGSMFHVKLDVRGLPFTRYAG
jgi:sugar lactone lactonase YvrE